MIGRPNVGKSSLVNRFLGEERVIVSERRRHDARRDRHAAAGRRAPARSLVDTAGMRRQSKVADSVEYYTALRSQRAAERADVALVVCDAADGVTAQDLRIAELAMKAGCATAIVLNKWDLHEGDRGGPRPRARARRREAAPAPARADRQRQDRPPRRAPARPRRSRSATAWPGASRRPSSTASSSEAVQARQPPVGTRRGSSQHRLKLIYMAQIGERPPRFAIQVNSRTRVTRDYAYFLENRLRARYGMDGVPLIIDFVERGQRGAAPRAA